jgi:hypothetical protein
MRNARCKAGAAGAVKRQVFRTPSLGETEGERQDKATGHPEPELKRGDDVCLCMADTRD